MNFPKKKRAPLGYQITLALCGVFRV